MSIMLIVILLLGLPTESEAPRGKAAAVIPFPHHNSHPSSNNQQWCNMCKEYHMKETEMVGINTLFTIKGDDYLISYRKQPFFNHHVMDDHLVAYANMRIERAANELWEQEGPNYHTYANNGRNYDLAVAAILKKGYGGGTERICCRGLVIADVWKNDPKYMNVWCAHAKCTMFVSTKDCQTWRVDAKKVTSTDLKHCLILNKVESGQQLNELVISENKIQLPPNPQQHNHPHPHPVGHNRDAPPPPYQHHQNGRKTSTHHHAPVGA